MSFIDKKNKNLAELLRPIYVIKYLFQVLWCYVEKYLLMIMTNELQNKTLGVQKIDFFRGQDSKGIAESI